MGGLEIILFRKQIAQDVRKTCPMDSLYKNHLFAKPSFLVGGFNPSEK